MKQFCLGVKADAGDNASISDLLVQDDTDGVVQQALSEDNTVQVRIDLVLLKDSENGDRVGG